MSKDRKLSLFKLWLEEMAMTFRAISMESQKDQANDPNLQT